MLYYQFIKQVNETEIGKRRTKEWYVHVPKGTNVNEIFTETSHMYKFNCKVTGEKYDLRLTIGREQRIVGLKKFYEDTRIKAGNRIIFERRVYPDNTSEYFIDVVSGKDSLFLQVYSTNGLRILNDMDNAKLIPINPYKIYYRGEYCTISLEYSKSVKSKTKVVYEDHFYNLKIGKEIVNKNYTDGEIIEITFKDNICRILEDISYQKIIIGRM